MALLPNTSSFRPLPENQKPGDPIRAKDAAETNRTVNALVQGVAPARRFVRSAATGSGSSIACIVVSVHKDHLVCTRKGSGTPIMVARPLAARSPASEVIFGQTWTYTYTDIVQATTPPSGYMARTATSGAQSEEQIVLRPYTAGGEIRAGRVLGGTGVPEADTYEEIHTDRTWYRKVAAA